MGSLCSREVSGIVTTTDFVTSFVVEGQSALVIFIDDEANRSDPTQEVARELCHATQAIALPARFRLDIDTFDKCRFGCFRNNIGLKHHPTIFNQDPDSALIDS